VRFEKWEALGNAYLLVEQPQAGSLAPERVRLLCDVRAGIGSDGVLEITSRDGTRASVVIWNPDGSTAETSGNGLRIAAAWLARESGSGAVTLESAGRPHPAELVGPGVVEIELGAVAVGAEERVEVDGESLVLTPVSVGNPHAVVRRELLQRDELLRLGPALERHRRFPQRTNVQLVHPSGPHAVDALVWERGAGETTASGSSAVAVAACAVARGWCGSPVTVRLPGGALTVRLAGDLATLVGPVAFVAAGETDL